MEQNPPQMEERRTMRADAERNRRRLLDAATQMFCERGLDVGVGDIAQQAGVGRGTLFRNFPSKEHLIAAIVVERMRESISRAHAALEAVDAGQSLFDLIEQSVARSQTDRALFDSIAETWLANDEIREVHEELVAVLDTLVRRAQEAGAVRSDISAIDVIMMIKGVCETAGSFQHLRPDVMLRQLDLVRAAISAPGTEQAPLRGTPPSLEDLEQVKAPKDAATSRRAATA